MARTATPSEEEAGYGLAHWQAGALAGLAGGVVMGVLMTMQMTPIIERAIPALYGLDGIAAGWTTHFANSAILGVAFATILVGANATDWSIGKAAGAGVAYGVVLWAVLVYS